MWCQPPDPDIPLTAHCPWYWFTAILLGLINFNFLPTQSLSGGNTSYSLVTFGSLLGCKNCGLKPLSIWVGGKREVFMHCLVRGYWRMKTEIAKWMKQISQKCPAALLDRWLRTEFQAHASAQFFPLGGLVVLACWFSSPPVVTILSSCFEEL